MVGGSRVSLGRVVDVVVLGPSLTRSDFSMLYGKFLKNQDLFRPQNLGLLSFWGSQLNYTAVCLHAGPSGSENFQKHFRTWNLRDPSTHLLGPWNRCKNLKLLWSPMDIVHGIWYRVKGIWYMVQSFWYRACGIWPSIWYTRWLFTTLIDV